jgi:hypothetical protein
MPFWLRLMLVILTIPLMMLCIAVGALVDGCAFLIELWNEVFN